MNNQGIWCYDIETLVDCFTYTAIHRDTEEVFQATIWKDINEMKELASHLYSVDGLIGYNNLGFDYPVIHFMLNNYGDWDDMSGDEITSIIYKKSQDVINDEWSGIKEKFIKIPQLDLFKIWHYDNRARMTSLKKLQIAFRYDNVQDMPYKHYEKIETRDQVQEILDYNWNDVDSTLKFYFKTEGKLSLRRGLHKTYGLKCMNYPDSKIGEELMLTLYCNETGKDYWETKKQRTRRSVFKLKDSIPSYIKLDTLEGMNLINYLEGITVEELKGAFKHVFSFSQQPDFEYHMGLGGLHGCLKAGIYKEDDEMCIVDIDGASYYPTLPVVNRLYPEHLGQEFLDVYREALLKPRFIAKGIWGRTQELWEEKGIINYDSDLKIDYEGADFNGDMISGYKLSMNAVYGKSNSEYSWVYDPLYTLDTTLAGQLSLVMLSEQVVTQIHKGSLIQANTDGITVMIPRSQKKKLYQLCQQWEKDTGIILEYQSYKQMILRDVNSYIAESLKGYVKYKGAFKTYPEMMNDGEYHKAINQMIVPEAIAKYFLEGIPVEETVMKCDNIYDFCKTFNATHGWTCETIDPTADLIDGKIYSTPRQKTNRYFISKSGETFRKLKEDRIIEIEAGGTLVTIFNTFEEKESIADYNIDYDYYIKECYKIIHKVDGTEERLLQEAKDAKERIKLQGQEDKFIKYCVDKSPTPRQLELYGKDWLIEKYGKPEVRQNGRKKTI